jgi:hypothetical protein
MRLEGRTMLGKPKLPLLVNDPKRRDLQFYSGYDERFLYRKVRILGAVLNDLNLLQQFPPEDRRVDLAKPAKCPDRKRFSAQKITFVIAKRESNP